MLRLVLLITMIFSLFYPTCSSAQSPALQQPVSASSVTVAKDGSGDFKTIQEAVNAIRDLSQKRVTIHIKNGTYNEKIVVPSWKTNLSFVGESRDSTIITYNDYSGKTYPGGSDAFGKDKFSTYTSYTVLVQGNNFTAENLTIRNTAGRVGQAVALHVEADRVVIKNCRLLGNQDTLYTATANSRQYYQDCYIEGTTDFIFGEATVVFQNCIIKSLINSYITAAATSPHQQFGFVLLNCKLIADDSIKKCFSAGHGVPMQKPFIFIVNWAAIFYLKAGIHGKGMPCFPIKKKLLITPNTKIPALGQPLKVV